MLRRVAFCSVWLLIRVCRLLALALLSFTAAMGGGGGVFACNFGFIIASRPNGATLLLLFGELTLAGFTEITP